MISSPIQLAQYINDLDEIYEINVSIILINPVRGPISGLPIGLTKALFHKFTGTCEAISKIAHILPHWALNF